MSLSSTQQAFYNLIAPLAQEASSVTGIDPNIIIAQAALETGWGASAPGNNYFGIKGTGGTQTTQEFLNGAWQTIKASFQGYSSLEDSVNGYVSFITNNPRYQAVENATNIPDQLKALQASGYATDPNYAKKLQGIINMLPDFRHPAVPGQVPD